MFISKFKRKPRHQDVISPWDFAKRMPSFFSGLPQRLQGLALVARQRPDTPSGLGLCLQQVAAANPQAPALMFEGRQWCYRDFNIWVNRVAHGLYRSGTRKGDVLAIFVENRPELLVIIAALAKIGAVAALLNTSQRGAVLQHSFSLVGAKRAFLGAELYQAFNELEVNLRGNGSDLIYVGEQADEQDATECPEGCLDFARFRDEAACDNPEWAMDVCASDPFCYFYTSGTTGLPKAAILTHGRFMKAYAGVGKASLQLTSADRVLVTLPFYHGTALVVGWGGVLAGHAALVLERRFSVSRFWQVVRDCRVTAFCYVGELCRYLLGAPASSDDRAHDIRLMFGNGLRPNIWQAFKQRYGIERVFEFYGSSEGNVGFMNTLNFDNTVGFTTVPYAIVQYDLENDLALRFGDGFMRQVEKGEAGLLLGEITDDSPFDGYTDPEKTEKTVLRNVFKQGDAWFNTGDLMRHQGFRHAQFVDRLGDTFRWKGENVSTTEVENVLAGHEAVLDGVVYGVEIPGTNGRAGMACLRLKPGAKLDQDGLYHHLNANLPHYAVPVFVRITDSLEVTGTHKYKKGDLKAQGFEVSKVADPIFVCLPKQQRYQALDHALCQRLNQQHFAF